MNKRKYLNHKKVDGGNKAAAKFKTSKGGFRSTNDVSWYNKYPELSKISGLVNEFKPLGLTYDWNKNRTTGVTGQHWMIPNFPGIMTLMWIPTPGVSTSPTDPINVSMSKFFTYMRLKNFSTSVYDPVDVAFYFLAMDSIFAMYTYMCMVYTQLRTYSFVNTYTPKAIASAMNVDFEDIMNHLDNLLFYINTVKERLSVIRVPKSIDYIARHMHMSQHIFKDADIDKAQMYLFVPQYLYQYDAQTPSLNAVPVGQNSTPLTFENLKTTMDGMLQAILPDEDMNIIAADIQKYVESDYWTVNSLDWSTMESPIYDPGMLWQIHNADIFPYANASGLNITQHTDSNINTIVYWNPTFYTPEYGVESLRVIDSKVNSPTSEEIIESSRLKFTCRIDTVDSTNFGCSLISCGSEIISRAFITQRWPINYWNSIGKEFITWEFTPYVRFSGANIGSEYKACFSTQQVSGDTSGNYYFGADLMSLLLGPQFDSSPIMYVVDQNGLTSTSVMNCLGPIGCLQNVISLDNDQVKALHDMALMSLWDAGSGR